MEEDAKTVNRRRLLRRAGTVVAGVGAAGVAGAIVADPASASAGDNVVAGHTVDAGTTSTGITNSNPLDPQNQQISTPTLALANGGTSGPQLRLVPGADYLGSDAPAGSLNAVDTGDLEYQVDTGPSGLLSTLVYTSYTATQTWPVTPFRALDTRGLGGVNGGTGREQILNPEVLNAQGKLPAGKTLLLDLSSFVQYGWAVLGNVTVQGPEAGGYVTVAPAYITRPNTSTVNFLQGWPISNCVFCGLGENPNPPAPNTQTDVLQLFSPVNTHVIFDVTGFIVPSIYNVNPAYLPFAVDPAAKHPSTATGSAATRAQRVRSVRPKW